MRPEENLVPVGVSGRHVHLSAREMEPLFGPDAKLHELKPLTQTGQYAAVERVTIVGPRGSIPDVRVLGPLRQSAQVELSRTDLIRLGIDAPLRDSGDIGGSPGIVLVGPRGLAELGSGVICARRHIHMDPAGAAKLGLADGRAVEVAAGGERGLAFGSVTVRVRGDFVPELHLDTDEANAAGLKNGDFVRLIL